MVWLCGLFLTFIHIVIAGQGPSLFICVNILTGYAESLYKVVSSLISELNQQFSFLRVLADFVHRLIMIRLMFGYFPQM